MAHLVFLCYNYPYRFKRGCQVITKTEVEKWLANSNGQNLIMHLKATAKLSRAMAKKMGLSEEMQKKAEIAGLLHDIGKAVPSFQKYIKSEMIKQTNSPTNPHSEDEE